jgi:Neurotransmitter-gated ion-channel ligand binding domain
MRRSRVCAVVRDSADTRLKEQRDAMAVVSCDGSVTWIPPAIYRSTCVIDITHFPFDIQKCRMKFGSWTYDGLKLDINFLNENQSSIDIGDYTTSNEWKLIGWPAKRNIAYYSGLNAPYLDITFWIEMQRVAIFHKYILVLPCVLLSFLTLVIFWLPPESPAKVMLGE